MAWQFDRPELGEGVVQAFRRAECDRESARLKLRGLVAEAQYVVTDLDSGQTQSIAGGQILEKGLAVIAPSRPSAPVLVYRQVR